MLLKSYDQVEPYDIVEAKINTGHFRWLDIIQHRWAYQLGTTLFENLGVVFEVTPMPVKWQRFGELFTELTEPKPIYIFDTSHHGKGLLLLDNKFAHACLASNPEQLLEDQPDELPDLDNKTHAELYKILSKILKDFQNSWLEVGEIQLNLKKVTTHPFRARVMHSFEKCLISRQMLRTHGFESELILCFPYLSLHPLLKKLDNKKVLPPESLEHYHSEIKQYFEELLYQAKYELVAEVGTIELGKRKNVVIKEGEILPIKSLVGSELAIRINNKPVLTADIGQSDEFYAVKISGMYEEKRIAFHKRPRTFKSIQWSRAE